MLKRAADNYGDEFDERRIARGVVATNLKQKEGPQQAFPD
jgi:hypothetical protein